MERKITRALRLLPILFCLLLCFALVLNGCNNQGGDETTAETTEGSPDQPTDSADTTAAPEPDVSTADPAAVTDAPTDEPTDADTTAAPAPETTAAPAPETTKAPETTYDPNHEHAVVVDEAVAPTCLAKGKTEGSHCSICGLVILKPTEIPATGHTTRTDPEVPASCKVDGETAGTSCSVCEKVFTGHQKIAAVGHNMEDVTPIGMGATCTEDGVIVYRCTRYNCSGMDESCVNSETTKYSLESGRLTKTVFEAKHHEYKAVVTPPNCTRDGYTQDICIGCGTEDEPTIDLSKAPYNEGKYAITLRNVNAHDYTNNYVPYAGMEPTCTETGTGTGICIYCQTRKENMTIPKLGHDAPRNANNIIDRNDTRTCEKGVYITYGCSRCDEGDKVQTQAPYGQHDTARVTVSPTCLGGGADGYSILKCGRQGCTYVDETSKQDPVTYDATNKAHHGPFDKTDASTVGSCTVQGTNVWGCKTCKSGDTYVFTYSEPDTATGTGHDLTDVAEAAAGCATDGTKAHQKCNKEGCGFKTLDGTTAASDEDLVIPALGHSYEGGVCGKCGDPDPNASSGTGDDGGDNSGEDGGEV